MDISAGPGVVRMPVSKVRRDFAFYCKEGGELREKEREQSTRPSLENQTKSSKISKPHSAWIFVETSK